MNQNQHIYAICCGPHVANDVISGRVANYEVAIANGFEDIPPKTLSQLYEIQLRLTIWKFWRRTVSPCHTNWWGLLFIIR